MHDLAPVRLTPADPRRKGDLVTVSLTLPTLADGERILIVASDGLTPILERSLLPDGRGRLVVHAKSAAKARGFLPAHHLLLERPLSVVFEVSDDATAPSIAYRLIGANGEIREGPETPIALASRANVDIMANVNVTDAKRPAIVLRARNDGRLPDVLRVLLPIPRALDAEVGELPASVSCNRNDDVLALTLTLGPQSETLISIPVSANERLYGDLVEITGILVSSQSRGTYPLDPLLVHFLPEPRLHASCSIDSPTGDELLAGDLVTLIVSIRNDGRSWSAPIPLGLKPSATLTILPQTVTVDGIRHVLDADLPAIRPHGTARVCANAIVTSPATDGIAASFVASLDGIDTEPAVATIRSSALFPNRRNYLWSDGARVVQPGARGKVAINIANTGTDRADRVYLYLDNGGLELESLTEQNHALTLAPCGGSGGRFADLGAIDAGEQRRLELTVLAPDAFADQQQFPLAGLLSCGDQQIDLGAIVFVGASAPRISSRSALTFKRSEPLRIGDERLCTLSIMNDGSDVAEDVLVTLGLPNALQIVEIRGASLEGDDLRIEAIPAQATARVDLTLALRIATPGDDSLEIRPIVHGERLKTIELVPLVLKTASSGHLGEFNLTLYPDDGRYRAELTLRNIGDGPVSDATAVVRNINGYLKGSTAVNNKPMPDPRSNGPLLESGLALPELQPGDTTTIRWAFEHHASSRPTVEVLVRSGLAEALVTGVVRLPSFDFAKAQRIDDDGPLMLHVDGTVSSSTLRQRLATGWRTPALTTAARPHAQPAEPQDSAAATTPSETEVQPTPAAGSPAIEPDTGAAGRAEAPSAPQPETEKTVDHAGSATPPPEPTLSDPTGTANDTGHAEPLVGEIQDTDETHTTDVTSATAPAEDFIDMTGPVGCAILDSAKSERLRTVLHRLDACPNIGWFRHVFAVRLLVPDQIIGVDGKTVDDWETIVAGISRSLSAPLVQTLLPDFEPTVTWMRGLIDQTTGAAVENVMRTLPMAIERPTHYQAEPWRPHEYYVVPTTELFGYVGEDARGDVGHLNALLAYLIVDHGSDQALVDALREYKHAAVEVFKTFVFAGNETQLRKMISGPHAELDTLLTIVLEHMP